MKSIFITGGAGLLGVNWAVAARDQSSVTLGLHDRVIALNGVATRRVPLDSVDAIRSAFDSIRPTLVVHAAGLTSVEKCEADPVLARRMNVDTAANVATACAADSVRLVHISTDHLFGDAAGPAAREDEPLAPLNVYGKTKAEAEQRVLERHPAALVARTNFYGWGPSYRPSFSDTVLRGLRASAPLHLFSDVTYTPIVIGVLVECIHALLDRGASGVYNVVGDECLSKHAFGLAVADAFGLDARSIVPTPIANRAGLVHRPRRMALDNSKARALLGRSLGRVSDHLGRLAASERDTSTTEIQHL